MRRGECPGVQRPGILSIVTWGAIKGTLGRPIKAPQQALPGAHLQPPGESSSVDADNFYWTLRSSCSFPLTRIEGTGT